MKGCRNYNIFKFRPITQPHKSKQRSFPVISASLFFLKTSPPNFFFVKNAFQHQAGRLAGPRFGRRPGDGKGLRHHGRRQGIPGHGHLD